MDDITESDKDIIRRVALDVARVMVEGRLSGDKAKTAIFLRVLDTLFMAICMPGNKYLLPGVEITKDSLLAMRRWVKHAQANPRVKDAARIMGALKSETKARQARINGSKGGRPRAKRGIP